MVKKQVILIEDEKDMADLVAMQLRTEHFDVEIAHRGDDGLRCIRQQKPDLVLLDLMLPGLSGIEIVSTIKQDSTIRHIPVIILTAKNDSSDIIVGLKLGADDYVTKPFSMKVLMARIHAVLRRTTLTAINDTDVVSFGPITVDRAQHKAMVCDNEIFLTLTEFRLLDAILSANGRVLKRNQLIDKVLGLDAAVTERTIDVHVTALRRKLGVARRLIQTIRGIGYRLSSD